MANFDDMIHAERGRLLRELPKGAKTICSAGCAGGWYFDWIAQEYGPVDRHIGVELYSPQPADLPANVQWIQNSVANMVDVGSGSVDLLISGQNIEHLYYDDLIGFLRESNRVVRDGGHLCVDSPNRAITQDLGYIQPQHVLELSVPEAIALVEAAGFRIVDVFGIWNCADGLKRYADVLSLSGDVEQRRLSARTNPQTSFIWWIVAQKTGPISPNLEEIVERIAVRSFQPFVAARFQKGVGRIHAIEGTATVIRLHPTDHGYAFFGPYIALTKGAYSVEFDVKFAGPGGSIKFDVAADGGGRVLAEATIEPSTPNVWQKAILKFEVADYTQAIETRAVAQGADAFIRLGSAILRD